jgi:hypothetical protein
MNDDDIEMEVVIGTGNFVGTCTRCREPSTGSFDNDESNILKMRCVNCGFKTHLLVENNFSFVICGGDNG